MELRAGSETGDVQVDYATYMLLWSPTGYVWNEAERLDILDATLRGETVVGDWSVYANRKRITGGDRVFLRKTGPRNPGIIASGWVTSEPYSEQHWDPARHGDTFYVDIEWDAMVDVDEALSLDTVSGEFPHSVWTAPGGGARVPGEAAGYLEGEWSRYRRALEGPLGGAGSGSERYEEEIVRRYAEVIVRARRHQRQFRQLLLDNSEPRCAYPGCGVDTVSVLEAAHIVPDSKGGEPTLENGILLCRNHHKALDLGIMGFDGEQFQWAPGAARF